MRLLFIGLAVIAAVGLLMGTIMLWIAPIYSIALLIPSSIYISAFMLAYILDEHLQSLTKQQRN